MLWLRLVDVLDSLMGRASAAKQLLRRPGMCLLCSPWYGRDLAGRSTSSFPEKVVRLAVKAETNASEKETSPASAG